MNATTELEPVERGVDGPFPIDVAVYLERAELDTSLRLRARGYLVELVGNLFEDQPSHLRVSDAGACQRAVWARVNGLDDLPADLKTMLTRFDGGALFGAWQAALLKAAIKDAHPAYSVRLEAEADHDGTPGHIDLFVETKAEARPVWVLDFKLTWFSKPPQHAHADAPYQALQAATYAVAKAAPLFSIFKIAPGNYSGKPWYIQSDYFTDEFRESVAIDAARLKKAAASDEEPEGDPQEPWRCKTCEYGGCDRNARVAG